MAVCVAEAGGADGFYELSVAVDHLRFSVLWNRVRLVRQPAAVSDILCDGGRLGLRDHFESYLAALLPIRSLRVAVEEPDLLEEAAF